MRSIYGRSGRHSFGFAHIGESARVSNLLTKVVAITLPAAAVAVVAVVDQAPTTGAAEVAMARSVSQHYLASIQHGHPTVYLDLQAKYGKGTKVYRTPTVEGGKSNVEFTVGGGQAFEAQGVVAYEGWQPVSYGGHIVYVQFHNSDIEQEGSSFTKEFEEQDSREHSTITIKGSEIIANHTLQTGLTGGTFRHHTPTSSGGIYDLS